MIRSKLNLTKVLTDGNIKRVYKTKSLGVIDDKPNWNVHSICTKTSKGIGILLNLPHLIAIFSSYENRIQIL